jgi:mannosyl-glycoprotein endo-beta-N-acetylglucosaminidase
MLWYDIDDSMCIGCHTTRPYFDLCDGIFLNYNWTAAGLASSAALARERTGEVYVGIDVFGRGCPGGGGYNSCEVIMEHAEKVPHDVVE